MHSTDTTKIFDHAQFYRIFVCNLTFGTMGELLFGLAALVPLLRRFEREVSLCRVLYTVSMGLYITHKNSSNPNINLLHITICSRWAPENSEHSSSTPPSSPPSPNYYSTIFSLIHHDTPVPIHYWERICIYSTSIHRGYILNSLVFWGWTFQKRH